MTEPESSNDKISPYERRQRLYRLLSGLPSTQFEELVFMLHPPAGVVSSGQSQQGIRTKELLDWAESAGGCQLEVVWTCLQTLIPNLQIPVIDAAADTTTSLKRTSLHEQLAILPNIEASHLSETSRRRALLIGVSEYGSGFSPLPAAKNDVEIMHQILTNSSLGGFSAQALINPDPAEIKREIKQLFLSADQDDLTLLFFSGHGIKGDDGTLYLSSKTTCKGPSGSLEAKTAIPVDWIRNILNQSISNKQVLIFDCCFSGSLAENLIKKGSSDVDINYQLAGLGRVILASSAPSQDSYQKPGMRLSVYTNFMVEGILTGRADRDNDYYTSAYDLHQYVKDSIQSIIPAMNPKIYANITDYGIRISKVFGENQMLADRELQLLKEEICSASSLSNSDSVWFSRRLPLNTIYQETKRQKILLLAVLIMGGTLLSWMAYRYFVWHQCLIWYEAYLGANEDVINKFRNKNDPNRIQCEKLGIYF